MNTGAAFAFEEKRVDSTYNVHLACVLGAGRVLPFRQKDMAILWSS